MTTKQLSTYAQFPLSAWAVLTLCMAFQNLQAQQVTAVHAVSITVEDIERETSFFVNVLGFKKSGETRLSGKSVADLYNLPDKSAGVHIVQLQLGRETIRLLDFEGEASRAIPADTRSNDLWFQHLAIVVRDMDAAYQVLQKANVTHVSTAPQTLPDYLPNAAGIKAFYFRDPEGHNLELIWFPPGKGDARWQKKPDGPSADTLFLGIDHTAIGVSNTDKSMAFYCEQLGLVWGGHSENYGTEQEHLNQVFGARLDINGLHAATGFGVEFLRYIAPPGGRLYPTDAKTSDLIHYQTEMYVDNLDKMIEKMRQAGTSPVSKSKSVLEGNACFLIRDPDGHAVLLMETPDKH